MMSPVRTITARRTFARRPSINSLITITGFAASARYPLRSHDWRLIALAPAEGHRRPLADDQNRRDLPLHIGHHAARVVVRAALPGRVLRLDLFRVLLLEDFNFLPEER